MYRNITTQAIVIRRERLGEFHKSLVLLTSDMGLVRAVAYGAYRMHSSLRMGSEPFTVSVARLYNNPVKQSYKVTELEIRQTFDSLMKDLSRIAAASLWAEVALKSYAAGETTDMLFRLFLGSLQLLERAETRAEPYVTIQFLWRFLSLAGYRAGHGCLLPLRYASSPGGGFLLHLHSRLSLLLVRPGGRPARFRPGPCATSKQAAICLSPAQLRLPLTLHACERCEIRCP